VAVRSAEEAGRAVAAAAGRPVVAVVRDVARYRWQAELVGQATVVVDVGWPAELSGPAPVVRTRGVAPALLAAAADLLAEP
jgi:beta-N-acetylhexosaminidase